MIYLEALIENGIRIYDSMNSNYHIFKYYPNIDKQNNLIRIQKFLKDQKEIFSEGIRYGLITDDYVARINKDFKKEILKNLNDFERNIIHFDEINLKSFVDTIDNICKFIDIEIDAHDIEYFNFHDLNKLKLILKPDDSFIYEDLVNELTDVIDNKIDLSWNDGLVISI